MIDLNKFTDKLCEYGISANQMLLCLFMLENDNFNMSRCFNSAFRLKTEDMETLKSKGILEFVDDSIIDPKLKYTPNNMYLTAKFEGSMRGNAEEQAKET